MNDAEWIKDCGASRHDTAASRIFALGSFIARLPLPPHLACASGSPHKPNKKQFDNILYLLTMKVLVGVKRVVDYAVKVRVTKGTVDLGSVKQSMNPFCEVRSLRATATVGFLPFSALLTTDLFYYACIYYY